MRRSRHGREKLFPGPTGPPTSASPCRPAGDGGASSGRADLCGADRAWSGSPSGADPGAERIPWSSGSGRPTPTDTQDQCRIGVSPVLSARISAGFSVRAERSDPAVEVRGGGPRSGRHGGPAVGPCRPPAARPLPGHRGSGGGDLRGDRESAARPADRTYGAAGTHGLLRWVDVTSVGGDSTLLRPRSSDDRQTVPILSRPPFRTACDRRRTRLRRPRSTRAAEAARSDGPTAGPVSEEAGLGRSRFQKGPV